MAVDPSIINPAAYGGSQIADEFLGGDGFFDPIRDQQDKKAADKRFRKNVDYNALYEAYLFNQEYGVGNEARLNRKLRRAGLMDRKTGEVLAPEGYEGTYDAEGGGAFDQTEFNRFAPFLKGQGLRDDWTRMQADIARKKMEDYKAKTLDPLTASITGGLQKMLDNPAIGIDELNSMKGSIVSQARSMESERLKRLGASMGIRGLDPGSFTGAVLANRVARETDERISEGIRNFDLQNAEIERQSQSQELMMGTQLSVSLAALETAMTQGNLEQLFAVNNQIASLHAAMAQQDAAIDAQKEANRYNLYSGVVQGLGNTVPG